jgi:hypothetical protein
LQETAPGAIGTRETGCWWPKANYEIVGLLKIISLMGRPSWHRLSVGILFLWNAFFLHGILSPAVNDQ